MVKDKSNLYGCTEEFDFIRLKDIATMSTRFVIKENYNDVLKVKGDDVPNGEYSDFECALWEMMNSLVRYGIKLEKGRRDERYTDPFDDLFNLRCAPHLDRIDVVQRE